MKDLLIHCGQVALPDKMERDMVVLVRDGKVTAIAPHLEASQAQVVDAAQHIVAPGFIDIHVHGGAGSDTMDATPEAYATMSAFFAKFGVTGWLATTCTAGDEATSKAVQAAVSASKTDLPGSALLGLHLEGPYLNAKWCGAQDAATIRPANPAEYEAWLASGVVKLITLAPEVAPTNAALLEEAHGRGIAVALGHTDCTHDQAKTFFGRGANQTTHTYNAMRGLHHREPGLVGAAMTSDVFCQLIADNIHVHPSAMQVLYACKGADRLALITDAQRAAGMPDGVYMLGNQKATVKNGQARLANGTLAGSVLTMDVAVRNLIAATHCRPHSALMMASATPAHAIGMADRKGKISLGYDADLVILGEDLRVIQTIVGGRLV
jgi:N-acetylglucosamine-6-phosphate deacetylase